MVYILIYIVIKITIVYIAYIIYDKIISRASCLRDFVLNTSVSYVCTDSV